MQVLFDYLLEQGCDPEPVLRHFGVTQSDFATPDVWVPVTLTDQIWARAAEVYRDPNLALHVAASLRTGRGGVISYLATYSADLRAALDRLIRFYPLISTVTRYRLAIGPEYSRLTCTHGRPCAGRQAEELSLALVVHFARKLCGAQVCPSRASFRSPAPADVREHVALFGNHIAFAASETWLELPTWMLDLPVASADEQLANLLEHAVEPPGAKAESGLPRRVKVQIAAQLNHRARGQCEDVARRMGMSPRTLRRKLAEAGTGFRALHDEVLAAMADRLLHDRRVPLSEVVERLQFSDERALANATRRWFGMTPQQCRELWHTDAE